MNNIFINEAVTSSINDYLDSKNDKDGIKYNSFLVVVIRLLNIIYDELDIITPFKLDNEEMFIINLQKYGYLISDIVDFNACLLNFYKKPNEEDFINIQKKLIDMFIKKKMSLNLTDIEIKEFRNLLFSSKSLNPLMVSFNYKMTNNVDEILNYFDLSVATHKKIVKVKEKKTLPIEAYKLLNYSKQNIDNMEFDELEKVNKRVYNYFEINENAINKDYLLDKAIFDLNHPKVNYSTGNGYVDIIFILAIIATLIMIIFIITLLIS